MIEVDDRVSDSAEDSIAGKLAVSSDVNAAIENKARRNAVNCRAHQGHGGGIRLVGPTEARDFGGHTPFPVNAMRICERREVIAIETACARTANPLERLIDVEMMRAEVLADENSRGVTNGADSNSSCRCRNRGRIEYRKG